MAVFYMDENVPPELSNAVRSLGHDVFAVQADGRASRGIDDPDVLTRAIELGRAVITNDRRDYFRLHSRRPDAFGIITYCRRGGPPRLVRPRTAGAPPPPR